MDGLGIPAGDAMTDLTLDQVFGSSNPSTLPAQATPSPSLSSPTVAAPPPSASSFQTVEPHYAADGEMTNLSPADYAKFQSGVSAKATPAISPSLSQPDQPNAQPGELSLDEIFKLPNKNYQSDKWDNQPQGSGLLANFAAGAGDTLLAPLSVPDPVSTLVNMGTRGINYLTGSNIPRMEDPAGPDNEVKKFLGKIGLNPDDVKAVTPNEYAMRGIGSVAPMVVAPWAMAGQLPSVGAGLAGAGRGALIGAFSGLGQDAGQNLAPPGYEGIGGTLGSIVGGGIGDLGLSVTQGLGRIAKNQISALAPVTKSMQQQQAALRIANRATDLPSVLDTLNADPNAITVTPNQPQLVPRSLPTTAQLTGDRGLANLERTTAAANPAPFLARYADQNSARVNELGNIAPNGADGSAVHDYVKAQLADLDAQHQAAINSAQTGVQQATDAIDGNMAPEEYGAPIRDDALSPARQAVKANENRLWNSIDPTGKGKLDVSPLPDAFSQIKSQIPQAEQLGAGESHLYSTVADFPDVQSFQELRGLRSTITNNMAQELAQNGRSPAYRRMTQMLGAVDDTIGSAVDRASGKNYNESGVQKGATHNSSDDQAYAQMLAEADQWKRDRIASARTQIQARGNVGINPQGLDASGSSGVSSASGSQGQARNQLGTAPGNQSLPPEPVIPDWTHEQTAAYAQARAATAARAATFDSPRVNAVGKALRPDGRGGYMMADEQVASRFFNGGSRSTKDLQDFMAAVGDRPSAVALLQDYAASTLRKAAIKDDGILDLRAFQKWKDRYQAPLRSFPELQSRFRNAEQAQHTLDITQAAYATARKEFENSAAKHFLGDKEPHEAIQAALAGGTAKARANMTELAQRVADSPDAQAGLQRATMDHILKKYVKPDGRIDGFALSKFVDAHQDALRPVMGEPGLIRIKNVVKDIERSQSTQAGAKLVGSNTAQDILGHLSSHEPQTVLGHIANESGHLASTVAIEHALGISGVIGASIGRAFAKIGVAKVDDLVTKAMLDPSVAKQLLTKIPKSPGAQKSWILNLLKVVRNDQNNNKTLDAKLYMSYNAPDKPPMPIGDYYKSGVPTDGQARIVATPEGHVLSAPTIIGRSSVGIPENAVQEKRALESLGESISGRPVSPLEKSQRRRASGGYDPVTGDILINPDAPQAEQTHALQHEIGHAIDYAVGGISQDKIKTELNRVYNTMVTGQERTKNLTRPTDLKYSPNESPGELMAEAIKAYIHNPNYLKTVAPRTAEAIRRAVNTHPHLSKIIQFNSVAGAGLGLGALGSGYPSQSGAKNAAP